MRKKIIAGNWKMNVKPSETAALVKAVAEATKAYSNVEVACCTPAIDIPAAVAAAEGTHVGIGAENAHWEEKGAYTGEISAAMLADVDCDLVILGHSERRTLFGDTDELVAEKAKLAFSHAVMPILCVGETLEEREAGRTIEVVTRQLRAVLDVTGIMPFVAGAIAYEPVWAIGTGKSATPADAQAVHAALRAELASYNADASQKVRILSGGSVKPGNARELFEQPDIDGALVGGAALKSSDFLGICDHANALTE